MIAVEVKGKDPNITLGIVGIYRAPKEEMRFLKNWQTGPDMWEELRSAASLEVISTCLMRIGMVMRKIVGGPRYF